MIEGAKKIINLGIVQNVVLALLIAVSFSVIVEQRTDAACDPLPTDKGLATVTVNSSTSGTYRVWTRIKASSSSNNSVFLQIDESVCKVTVGDANIPANTWTWVDYQSGNTSSKINATLNSGAHTVKLAGREADVRVDKVMFVADMNCVPSGNGDNCVAVADTTPPSSPSNLRVSSKSSTEVNLAWNASSDASGVSGYDVYRNNSLLGTSMQTTYKDSGLQSATAYTYTVRARDASGNVSGNSNSIQVTTDAPPDTTPPPTTKLSTPTNLSAVAGDSKVALTWDNISGANNYTVRWGTGGAWSNYSNQSSNSNNPTTNSYTVDGLTNGTLYNFSVAARDSSGTQDGSDYSSPVSATPADSISPSVSLTAPANNSSVSGSAVLITANATDASGVTGVDIYLNDSTRIGRDTQAPYQVSLDSTTLVSGRSYRLHAIATDASGNTGSSSIVNIVVNNAPLKDTQPPAIPTGLIATGSTLSSISLKWNASSDNVGVSGYDVYRDGFKITSVTSTTYTDRSLNESTEYTYYVRAFDAETNVSGPSGSVTAETQTPADTDPPAVVITEPINNATVSGDVRVAANASDASGIASVDFYLNDSYFVGSDAQAPYGVNAALGNIASGTTVRLHAVAKDNAGNVASSAKVSVMVNNVIADTQAPTIPANVRASASGTNQINIAWNASSDNVAVSGYEVYRNGALIVTLRETATSFGDTGLDPNSSYYYTLKAFDAAGNYSAHSARATAQTEPEPEPEAEPGSLFGRLTGAGQVVSGATVTIIVENKRYTYTASSNGYYFIRNLPAGEHSVRYSASGYDQQTLVVRIKSSEFTFQNVDLKQSPSFYRRSWWWGWR